MKCVHLDFHTSPTIDGIGTEFDAEKFTKTLKEADVDLVTVFAKCHHGYCYYPTKVGTMHPGLKFNLLAAEIEAIHKAGAKAPIYITMGWSKKDADDHPEWRHIDFNTRTDFFFKTEIEREDPDRPLNDCGWTTLCPVGGYGEHLAAITREVCEKFDVSDGIFYDICFIKGACACPSCLEGMRKRGYDTESLSDAQKYFTERRIEMMQELSGIVHEFCPTANVFFNGGANMNFPAYHPYQTHYELEDLPTAWGGYDLMPLRAKYFERYGKYFMGMTGKFHHAWGEFGGFKSAEALRYECADMVSVGASISVGDHLHPSGDIDKSTYAVIGHAFHYIKELEPHTTESRPYTDIALFVSHSTDADMGASKLLQVMHLDFDVVDSGDSLDGYRIVILPDFVKLTDADKAAILAFRKAGGTVIASYDSIFEGLGIEKIGTSSADKDFISCEVDELVTPFLSYSSAMMTKSDYRVLADVYEPMFNRTYGRFCGHKNTPYKREAASYPALVAGEGLLYFAHPVFTAYEKNGSYALERYIIKGIREVYDPAIKTEELPSCARVRLRRRLADGALLLHVLYAPPVNRGNVCLLPDFPKLHDVKITLRVDGAIKSVKLQPSGEEIAFTQDGDTVTLALPPFRLHTLVVLEK